MSCYKLVPYQLQEETYINIEKLLPLDTSDNYYVNLMDRNLPIKKADGKIVRRKLPKIDKILEWGVVQAGDIIIPKDIEGHEAILLENGNIEVNGKELSIEKYMDGPQSRLMLYY